MKKGKLLIVLIFLAVMGYIVYSAISLNKISCEVCVEFKGRELCRTARGPTREEAIGTAHDNACAQIAQGRTDSVLCGGTLPRSVQCGEGGEAE